MSVLALFLVLSKAILSALACLLRFLCLSLIESPSESGGTKVLLDGMVLVWDGIVS